MPGTYERPIVERFSRAHLLSGVARGDRTVAKTVDRLGGQEGRRDVHRVRGLTLRTWIKDTSTARSSNESG